MSRPIGGTTPPATPSTEKEKTSEKSKNENKEPTLGTKKEKQEGASKRNAYKNSQNSSQAKRSLNLPRFAEERSSERNQPGSTATSTTTNTSALAKNSSTSSSESDGNEMLSSTAPTTQSRSSTTTSTSTSSTTATAASSTPVANPAWAKFHERALMMNGWFEVGEHTNVETVISWLASSPAGVTRLSFWGRDLAARDAVAELAAALKVNTVLTDLTLGINNIDDEGAKALAEALKVNTTLKELELGFNLIGDDGIEALAEALKVNKTLISLKLDENPYDAYSAENKFAEALKFNKTVSNIHVKHYSNFHFYSEDGLPALLYRNRRLKKIAEDEAAVTELQRINMEQAKQKNVDPYPPEIMRILGEKMSQLGFRDEIIELGEPTKPKE